MPARLLNTSIVTALLFGSVTFVSPSTVVAREPFADYFQGLRSQGLFRLAEQYGLRRLNDGHLTTAERSELAVELSRTFSAHALSAGGTDQADLWMRAEEVLVPALDPAADNPRRVEARVQQALVTIDRGLGLAWKHVLFPEDAPHAEAARTLLQKGLAELAIAEAELADVIKRGRITAAQVADGFVSPAELKRLHERVLLQLGIANVELARVSVAREARQQALREATKFLDLLTRTRFEISSEARLQKIVVARLSGDFDLATTLVNDLRNDTLPPAFQDRVLAEEVRVLVRQGKHPDAVTRVLEARKQRAEVGDEVRAALIEAFLEAWIFAWGKLDDRLAEDIWQRMQAELKSIQGPWRIYADLRVEQADDVRKYGDALAAQIRLARTSYQAGEIDRAIEQFAEAIGQAMQGGQTEAAIELASARASVLLSAKRYPEAAVAFRQIVERFPDGPQTPDASLLETWALGQQAQSQPSAAHREAYIAALVQHLQSFSQHATAAEASWMLAQIREQEQAWNEALRLYESIPAASPHFEDARRRLARGYVESWRAARRDDGNVAAAESDALAGLTRIVDAFPAPPQLWSAGQCDQALQLVLLEMSRSAPAFDSADRILIRIDQSVAGAKREARRDMQPLDPEWPLLEAQAARFRIVLLAGRNDFAEARRLLGTLGDSAPQELLSILNGLTDLATALPPESRLELGRLQLDTARRLQARQGELDPPAARQLALTLAQAYAVTGNLPEAVAVYQQLLEGEPGNKELMQTAAGLLIQRGQQPDLEKARGLWQQLEAMEKKGTAAWMEARLHLGETMLALNQSAEVQKLVRVTRILYPELGGPALRTRFEELEQKSKPR